MDLNTGTWVDDGARQVLRVRRCRFEVLVGPDRGAVHDLAAESIRIGRKGVEVELNDRAVSGVHAEIRLTDHGYRLTDLDSSNGTFVAGMRVKDVYLLPGAKIALGGSQLKFEPLNDSSSVPLWRDVQYASLLGKSWVMRRLYALVEKIALTEATVLITGETGTGKELVAEAVHQRSPRREGPFVVLDCGAIPAQLMEAQIFGHERGSFTGATQSRPGVFEQAHGGTLFLDEIGELPLGMQAKLLRAVETRTVRRIGAENTVQCDVRLVAATHRDLARETNQGTFRSDLYYRLAVALVSVPPLRERLEDLDLLVESFAADLAPRSGAELPGDFLERARTYSWPGNVRELRNTVEQALVAPGLLELEASPVLWQVDTSVPFKVAKQRFVDEFDRRFMSSLLEEHDWNIAAAARSTGVDRMSVYKLLQRLGIRRQDAEP